MSDEDCNYEAIETENPETVRMVVTCFGVNVDTVINYGDKRFEVCTLVFLSLT